MKQLGSSTIPVFFHVPKCAGTYAISQNISFMRRRYLDLIHFDKEKRRDAGKILKNIAIYKDFNGTKLCRWSDSSVRF